MEEEGQRACPQLLQARRKHLAPVWTLRQRPADLQGAASPCGQSPQAVMSVLAQDS